MLRRAGTPQARQFSGHGRAQRIADRIMANPLDREVDLPRHDSGASTRLRLENRSSHGTLEGGRADVSGHVPTSLPFTL